MNQKRNYQIEMERVISESVKDSRPSIILHSCCAPCSSHVLECLSPHFDITVFYCNPNIFPEDEYEKRKREQIRLIENGAFFRNVTFLNSDYDHDRFLDETKGFAAAPEGKERCFHCFSLRLEETAKTAQSLSVPWFATTLTVSPHKNADLINRIGEGLSRRYGVRWLPSDFKKKNGYQRSVARAKELGLYRQDYCGCEYSKRDSI